MKFALDKCTTQTVIRGVHETTGFELKSDKMLELMEEDELYK